MSSGTSPDNKSNSSSDKSAQPTEQFKNIDQLAKRLESFVEQIAKLIVTKNWVSLLLLVDAVLILFFFPGGVIPQFIKTTFGIDLPEQYPILFWATVGGIFLIALVIAIKTIQRKSPPLPDFTERKAIKGLRAFSQEDAEIFAQLQRERDLRECLESITSKTFRLGILMGESGVGKTSFLQAGILPQLLKSESTHRGVYIRFSNQDPMETIYNALDKELKLSETQETQVNNRDLLSILSSSAVATVDKPLILIFDQFEQFFVHFKQKIDREPLINALKDWYINPKDLPVKIFISIREDLLGRLIELQKALGYSLSPHEVYHLGKFSPKEAAKILQVIAEAEKIKFDEKFVDQLTESELASREDGLISPVDLQVLAWTIERQNEELQAFNRAAFQKIGGIEGLMTRFLNKTLDARVIPSQRQATIKVLLAMTNLERNVRAGVLTLDDLQQKIQGTLQPGEIVEATTWLASGGVRLITPVDKDGKVGYELAHERLIPALREVAGKDLTTADKANQLLDRRVNEWLGNNRQPRYLFNWQELRLIQQQKPYLVWGANQSNKEKLLKCSWQKLYRQLVAVGIALVFCLVGIVWWHTPWGQIQQVRWELARLSKRVSSEYKGKGALAFFKDADLKQALKITKQIDDSSDKARVLVAIAESIGNLENIQLADKYLSQAVTAAKQIDDSSDKARVLRAIAESIGNLENIQLADKYLSQAVTAAKQIDHSYYKAWVLVAIAETYGKLENIQLADKYLSQAVTAAKQIDNSDYKARVLVAIAESIGNLENIQLADKYLSQAVTAAEQIDNSDYKAWVLVAIAQTQVEFHRWRQAHNTVFKCPTDECKVASLAHILTAWAEKKNPALVE